MPTISLVNVALVTLLFTALGTKQIAFILLHGSIFVWVRDGIRQRMETGRRGFRTLHDLFSCPLCMTAQVSIWFVAVLAVAACLLFHPFQQLGLGHIAWPFKLLLTLFAAFFLAMANAAVAMLIWNMFEYSPERYASMKRSYESHIKELLQALASHRGTATPPLVIGVDFRLEDFADMARELALCDLVGCEASQANCREFLGQMWISAWADHRRPQDKPIAKSYLMLRLPKALRAYRKSVKTAHLPEERAKLLQEAFDDLVKQENAEA